MTQPFQFPNGQLAHSADDLLALCQQFPDDGTNYLVREDLEKWLTYIGKSDIAQCAISARQTALADRQKLEEFLNKCHSLVSPKATKVTTIEETTSVKKTEAKVSQPSITGDKIKNPVETIKPLRTIKKTSVGKIATKESNIMPQTKTETETSTASATNTKKEKPSFFKLVAGLVVNILYRDKN